MPEIREACRLLEDHPLAIDVTDGKLRVGCAEDMAVDYGLPSSWSVLGGTNDY